MVPVLWGDGGPGGPGADWVGCQQAQELSTGLWSGRDESGLGNHTLVPRFLGLFTSKWSQLLDAGLAPKPLLIKAVKEVSHLLGLSSGLESQGPCPVLLL